MATHDRAGSSLRLCIAGVPRAGKTTLAGRAAAGGCPVRHTDDLIGTHGWSEASAEAATWLSDAGPWVIEGVAVARALRKWLAANPEGLPADVVVFLVTPRVQLSDGQSRMAKGCETVWSEIQAELGSRGVLLLVI